MDVSGWYAASERLLLDIIEGRMKGRPKGGRKRLQMFQMLAKDGCVARS